MQDGRSQTPKTVPGHRAFVAHTFQRLQNGVIAHAFLRVAALPGPPASVEPGARCDVYPTSCVRRGCPSEPPRNQTLSTGHRSTRTSADTSTPLASLPVV